MLSLILILLVLWLALSLLLAAGTLFLQAYFNETPPDLKEVAWRGPAGGAAVAAFAALWTFLYYNHPDAYAPFLEFSATEEQPFFPKLWAVQGKQKTEYVLRKEPQGPPRYYQKDPPRQPLPSRPDEIIVAEDGEEAVFRPDRDAQGKFKPDPNEGLRYRDERGRVMREGYLGQLTTVRRGRTFVYFLLNLVHGAIWFACFWPLLRFSLGQAVVLALACWLTMTLVVMPPVLTQARNVAREKARAAEQAAAAPLFFSVPRWEKCEG